MHNLPVAEHPDKRTIGKIRFAVHNDTYEFFGDTVLDRDIFTFKIPKVIK